MPFGSLELVGRCIYMLSGDSAGSGPSDNSARRSSRRGVVAMGGGSGHQVEGGVGLCGLENLVVLSEWLSHTIAVGFAHSVQGSTTGGPSGQDFRRASRHGPSGMGAGSGHQSGRVAGSGELGKLTRAISTNYLHGVLYSITDI